MSENDSDPSRRTRLAVERTWLAWWRTGLAATVAAIAIGRVAPQALHVGRTAYAVLGVGYAAMAVAIFLASYQRYRSTNEAMLNGGYAELNIRWVLALAVGGGVLALGTLVLLFVDA